LAVPGRTMRIIAPKDGIEQTIEGAAGVLKTLNIIDEASIVCGLRHVGPNAQAPKPSREASPHHHLVYALQGWATVSNGEYYEKLQQGMFALFTDGERPHYRTGDQDFLALEFAWAPGGKGPKPMATVPSTLVAQSPPMAPVAPPLVRKAGVYEEV
jgi:hypothetical protein